MIIEGEARELFDCAGGQTLSTFIRVMIQVIRTVILSS